MKNACKIVLLVLLVQFTLSQEPVKNCQPGKCAKCLYKAQGYSCENCYFSKRIYAEKEEGQEDQYFTCSEENDIEIENCAKLDLDPQTGLSDPKLCESCALGYFEANNNTDCKKFQIPNCNGGFYDAQNDKEVCMVCQAGFVVKNNECVNIQTSDKIDNCKIYITVSNNQNEKAREYIKKSHPHFNFEEFQEDLIYCQACKSGYYEESPTKCTKNAEKAKCIQGKQDVGQTTTCIDCAYEKDFWSIGPLNNYDERQICVYKSTRNTEGHLNDLDVPVYLWIVSLCLICLGICVIQCKMFAPRTNMYAENKPGYVRPEDEEAAEALA